MLGFVGVFDVYPRACNAHMQHMHLQGRESVRSHTHTFTAVRAHGHKATHAISFNEIVRAGEQSFFIIQPRTCLVFLKLNSVIVFAFNLSSIIYKCLRVALPGRRHRIKSNV